MPTRKRNTVSFNDDELQLYKLTASKCSATEAIAIARQHEELAELSQITADNVSLIIDPSIGALPPSSPKLVEEYWRYDAMQHNKFAAEIMSLCGRELLTDVLARNETA